MKTILYILILSFSSIFCGCFTYYPSRENPDSVKTEQERYFRILKFYLLDGNSIDVSNYEVKYYNNYKNNKDVFVFTQTDTIQKSLIPDSIKIKSSQKIIPSDRIKFVVVERRKTDTKSSLITAGIIVGSVALLLFIAIAATLPHADIHL
jgi:hypothetical protein